MCVQDGQVSDGWHLVFARRGRSGAGTAWELVRDAQVERAAQSGHVVQTEAARALASVVEHIGRLLEKRNETKRNENESGNDTALDTVCEFKQMEARAIG